MQRPTYGTIEDLSDAIDAGQESPDALTLYLDGGEVIVRAPERDVYRGAEQEVLVALFDLYLGIHHESI